MQLFKECRLENDDYQKQQLQHTIPTNATNQPEQPIVRNALPKVSTTHHSSENEAIDGGNGVLLVSILVRCLLQNENLWKDSAIHLTPPTATQPVGHFDTQKWLRFANAAQSVLTDVTMLKMRKYIRHKVRKVFDTLKIYLIIYVYKGRGGSTGGGGGRRKFSIYNFAYRTFYCSRKRNWHHTRRLHHNKCCLSFCVKTRKIFCYPTVNKGGYHHHCSQCRCRRHQYQAQRRWQQNRRCAHTSPHRMNANGVCRRNLLQKSSMLVRTIISKVQRVDIRWHSGQPIEMPTSQRPAKDRNLFDTPKPTTTTSHYQTHPLGNSAATLEKIYFMKTTRTARTTDNRSSIAANRPMANNSRAANKSINKFLNKTFSVRLNKSAKTENDQFNDDAIKVGCLCGVRGGVGNAVGGMGLVVDHQTNNRKSWEKHHHSQHTPQSHKFWRIVVITIFMICTPIVAATSMHGGGGGSSGTGSGSNIKYSTDVVKTKYGQLRGIMLRSNPPVEAFLGVPYATPPLGSLRYMPPVTPSTWKNTRLADRFSPVCPQAPPVPPAGPEALLDMPRERLAQLRRLLPLLANQSEDCLYLNLYVPRTGETTGDGAEKSLATIVYIHGESYEWNSGNPYDGSVLAAHGRIIVVTINFRLGVLGFLKTGNKGSAQGNFGLMDLVAGLHWLHENLPAFNGDPSRVTLMGHGTGAALANMLVVSPVASDLVHRAILFSGSALSPWAIQKDPLYLKRRIAEHTGCHGDLLEDDIAPCLRQRPISELLSVTLDSPRFLPGFAPFVDGTVLVNPSTAVTSPLTLPAGSAIASTLGIELADFPARELLFGLTTIESYLDLSAQDLEFGFNDTRKDRILRTYVRNIYHYHLNEIYSALKNEYTDWERPPRNLLGSRDAALELLSDGHTAAPLVRLGYLHSLRGGKSYFLHFRHQSGERDFTQRSGSVRGEDVPFCLGLPLSPLFPYNYTKQDIQISRVLVRYLGNFAKNGNPNEPTTSNKADISHNHGSSLNLVHSEPKDGHQQLQQPHAEQQVATGQPTIKRKRGTMFEKRKRRSNRGDDTASTAEDDEEEDDEEYEERRGEKRDEDEDEEEDYGDHDTVHRDQMTNRDRIMDGAKLHMPFWDTYDSINQLYLELGKKVDIRNHYRGHKLSMWLSLIPQLHAPGDTAEMSMRHHHFAEENAQYYDGIVRPQSFHRPPVQKIMVAAPPKVTTTMPVQKTDITPVPVATTVTTTECLQNTTVVPTIAATRPQQNNDNTNNGLLKRLANTHYQSYATALTVTIAVGCFLLLLNMFIFAAIYYQREKRANDTKKKEELTEAENLHMSTSPSIDRYQKGSRKSSLQSVSGAAFGEYSCYDDKLQCKEKRALVDLCTVELPLQDFKHHSPSLGSHRSSIRRSGTPEVSTCKHAMLHASAQENLVLLPPTYSSYPASIAEGSSTNGLVQYRSIINSMHSREQSTQSDEICDAAVPDTSNMTTETNKGPTSPDDIPDPPPPPKHVPPACQAGILRQHGGPQTPSTSKKRVQIQEISV